MKKAVVDIGTNTIHLIIAEILENQKFTVLKKVSKFIRIARDGTDPISEESIQRALYCLHDYSEIINQYACEVVEFIGTEALRSATNKDEILLRIKDVTGYDVRIVSGDEEAQFIYLGSKMALPEMEGNFMIMDIGGGSVEFIIANQKKLIWKKSYKIGVQYLFTYFNPSDPISQEEIGHISKYLFDQLEELRIMLNKFPIRTLVGASGSFEIVAGLTNTGFFDKRYAIINQDDFIYTYDKWVFTTLDQRLTNNHINPDRAELLVMGLLLMKIVYDIVRPPHLYVSNYALREGVLTEINSMV